MVGDLDSARQKGEKVSFASTLFDNARLLMYKLLDLGRVGEQVDVFSSPGIPIIWTQKELVEWSRTVLIPPSSAMQILLYS